MVLSLVKQTDDTSGKIRENVMEYKLKQFGNAWCMEVRKEGFAGMVQHKWTKPTGREKRKFIKEYKRLNKLCMANSGDNK